MSSPPSDPHVEADIGAAHFELLRLLSDQPCISQRALSHQLGFSLGKTHYVLRALAAKGWVKAHNFTQSQNKAAYGYLLTPSGIAQKFALTRSFLQHKEIEFERLQREIETLRMELAASPRS